MRELLPIAAAAALALASCGTAGRIGGTADIRTGAVSSEDSGTVTAAARAADTCRTYSETEAEFTYVREEFDTSMPVDSATGTPPLRSRETVRGRTRTAASAVSSSVSAAALAGSAARSETVSARDSSYTPAAVARTEAKEKAEGRRFWRKAAVWTAVTAAAGIAVLLAAKTFKGRLSGIWKLIKGFFKN